MDRLKKENFDLKLKMHNMSLELEKVSNVKRIMDEVNIPLFTVALFSPLMIIKESFPQKQD
jgi:hypothetical protein